MSKIKKRISEHRNKAGGSLRFFSEINDLVQKSYPVYTVSSGTSRENSFKAFKISEGAYLTSNAMLEMNSASENAIESGAEVFVVREGTILRKSRDWGKNLPRFDIVMSRSLRNGEESRGLSNFGASYTIVKPCRVIIATVSASTFNMSRNLQA